NMYGHGQISLRNRQRLVHRLAYECLVGPIPDGMQVNHTCNVPNCCNPLHLYLGSQQDNMDDMVRDGRSCAGIASGMAALSTKDATEVLRLVGGDKSYAAIARRLGVSHSVVSSIAHGKTYKDIPGERREPRQPANRFFGVSKNGNKWLVRLRLD